MAAATFSQTFFAPGGSVAASCKAYVYVRGTTTPKQSFTSVDLSTPTTNPVIGSSVGVLLFYLDGDEDCSLTIKTSDDATTLMQVDYVANGGFFSIISYTIENVQFAEFSFTGDGAENEFTLTGVSAPSSFSLWATVSGVYQAVTSYTATRVGADTVVAFTDAPPLDAEVYIRLLSLQGQTGPKGDPGDVSGPGVSTTGNIALFADTSGGVLADGGKGVPAGVIVGTTDAQTLSNKTLTSPVVNTPTIAGGTVASRVAVSSETSGTLTSASANKTIQCTGGVTLPATGMTSGDVILIDPGGTARTITRPAAHTMYIANTNAATGTTGAHNIVTAMYHGSSKWTVQGDVV